MRTRKADIRQLSNEMLVFRGEKRRMRAARDAFELLKETADLLTHRSLRASLFNSQSPLRSAMQQSRELIPQPRKDHCIHLK
ncbi:hypothetical protein KIN20_028971 [Parelaphostrongylus tenuis]|uniref:Uncharacterized protein n=1 Tax=Parelaphostrongylus tenuis TaxID=148309 RepID=A0AAD5WF80_PARTN|nr:hypothetical protein KIN20_028971 [Parelaphostrongylus tenuis]